MAYAYTFQHTYSLWNHGIDGKHVYMTRTDGGGSEGVVAYLYNCGSGGICHSGPTRYSGNHVHVNGCESLFCGTGGGHFSSPGPFMSHHGHP